MIFPIKNWKTLRRGYLFMKPTFYSPHHLGVDIIAPSGTPIYAWQDLEVVKYYYSADGGNAVHIKCKDNPRLFRIMHLLHHVKLGKYKQGAILAQVGNTGRKTTGSHAHFDISKNWILELNNLKNFEDPDAYFNAFCK